MKVLEINGGKTLEGTIRISGAKNSAVALIPAAILADGESTICNVPEITDIDSLAEILDFLGAKVSRASESILINPETVVNKEIPKELSTKLVKSTQPQYSTAEIVTYSLLCGALVSVLIVVLYMKLAVGADEVEPASNTLNPEADYIDAEIVDEAGTEDIDYPYEDIGTLFEETEG